MSLLVSFLNLVLYIAIIVLVAFGIRWLITGLFKTAIDPDVEKWARIVVALLIIIAVFLWLLSLAGYSTYGPPLLWR